jgi:hypothetical protein
MEPLSAPTTVPDLIDRERRSDAEALLATGSRRQIYTAHRFCTTAWQTGNFLRQLGVRDGVIVGVTAEETAAQPILTLFGTALLGGITWIGPPDALDARAIVAPVETVERYELPAGGQRAGYGGDPDAPGTYHFEEEIWSENPTRVPREYDPTAPVLTDGDHTYSHEQLLAAAQDVVDTLGLTTVERVGVRTPLSDPRTVAAGILAPLIAGAAIVLTDGHDVDAVITSPEDDTDVPSCSLDAVALSST